MLDRLEALRAVQQAGTTAAAAVRLRVTQSAVSKRLAALEAEVGAPLVERSGRRLALTAAGERLIADATPLLAALHDVLALAREPVAVETTTLRIAASESLLSSWLPATLMRVRARVPGIGLELHAHRGPTLVERVRSGDYALALCVASGASGDLVETALGDEAFVLVPAEGRPAPRGRAVVEAWTIEERSLTWAALAPKLRQRERPWGLDLRITGRLESFTALVQVARVGMAHALVPRGVAVAMGLRASDCVALPGLTRPLVALSRRRALERRVVRAFLDALHREMAPSSVSAPARRPRA
jgi:DNA-binding transcriptional LysR family regulator